MQSTLDHIRPLHHVELDMQELEDSDEDEDELELGDGRLEELVGRAESGDLNIEDLTAKELSNFRAELKKGSLDGSQNASKDAWWHRSPTAGSGKPMVVDCSKMKQKAVAIPSHICCGEGRKPHASVALASLSVVYAYVHTMKAFGGSWAWAPMEAVPQLLHLCPIICSHQVYNSAVECLQASLEAAASLPAGPFGAEFEFHCLADAQALIRSSASNCASALQDISLLFEECLAGGGCGRSGKLRRGLKKLEFLASFVYHHFELLQPLAEALNTFAEDWARMTTLEMD